MVTADEVAVQAPGRAVREHVKRLLLRIVPATGRVVLSGATYSLLPSRRESGRVEQDRRVHPSCLIDGL
jgi:hypothetical protein